ncbi:hypothetical protein RB653_004858 [Dictyostelium firmibasis]|uniref:Large ribosomal subunit protein mL52 n=1 Tax=Dictyostelium firmibasis TaxID=79012 RepID=A0AAN7Z0H6_9MYCE
MNTLIRRSLLNQINLNRAGQSYRLSVGRMRSGNEDGPLHDLSDFHFADGREAPLTEKQMKWKKTRLSEENILNSLKSEVEAERQNVIDKIKDFEESMFRSIESKREKKKQRDALFEKKQ